MYIPKQNVKRNPKLRWAQPDRRFFACGACHMLAYAFLDVHQCEGFVPVWIRPKAGFTGNHIFVTQGCLGFDYHGYSDTGRLLERYWSRARRYYRGWDATLVELAPEELLGKSLREDLRVMPQDGFLHDPIPRAKHFVERFQYAGGTSSSNGGQILRYPSHSSLDDGRQMMGDR